MRTQRVFDSVVLAVILAACGICVSYYLRTRAEFSAAINKKEAATERLAGLASDVERLERQVERLRTDAKAFEELARYKLGLVRQGDVVIKLPQTGTEAAAPVGPQAVQLANLTPQAAAGYTSLSH
ncbi:MAG TPA: septum formation initiator family protein [Blastocatellia bacterium]|nr:septum formation initiator family protein [Blastocatellia bacterium]